jgi:hypothetical protein
MRVDIMVDPSVSRNEFAAVRIHTRTMAAAAHLDLEYTPILDRCGPGSDLATDLLLIGACVYAIDKAVVRGWFPDRWTRQLEVSFPVSDPARWEAGQEALQDCLGYLTGDVWQIGFSDAGVALVQPSDRREGRVGTCAGAGAVSLFSGGLDSLIGVIDWLETHPDENLLLVGHHDRHATGPKNDQELVFGPLAVEYRGRVSRLSARVGLLPAGPEITFRSRSLLFLTLGLHAASTIGPDVPVLIPENGTIALNVPLTPARRGSCSTRTAHPYYLDMLGTALREVGITNPIHNPLRSKTKGECVRDCLNQQILRATYAQSMSCAKRGHRRSWVRRDAPQCGRCMPCIYRRAALRLIGWDDRAHYGNDVRDGEVPVTGARVSGNDLRACLAFLQRQPSTEEIASRLLANGSIPVGDLRASAALVERAMEEVRALFRSPGTHPDVRHAAGLHP